jgi:VWFA-related protein
MVTRMRSLVVAYLVVASLLSATHLLVAQTAPPIEAPAGVDVVSQPFVIHSTVNRVLVDVTVVDKQGNPVTNLNQDDFKVEEDNKTQRILSFDTHSFEGPMDYVPPPLPPRPANTFIDLPSAPERGPLNVIFYDVANIPPADQMFARQQMTKFIKDKPEGARFAIFVGSGGPHLIQGFSSDKQELLAAIDPKEPHPRLKNLELMGRNLGGNDKLGEVSNLNVLARYLEQFPGRKNLFWLASQFPLSTVATDQDPALYEVEIKRAIDLLATNRIAVFPVDTRGVVISEEHDQAEFASGAPSSAGAAGTGSSLVMASYDTQDQIALMTGGRAFHSNNDMKGSLETATRLGGSYYTLSYNPSNKNYDGKMREIRVTMARPGYFLIYRHGYYGTDTNTPIPGDRPAQSVAQKPLQQRPGGDGVQKPAGPQEPGPADVSLSASMAHGAPALHQLIFGAKVSMPGPPAMGTPDQMARLVTEDAFRKTSRHSNAAKPAIHPVKLQPYLVDYTITEHQFQVDGPKPEIQIAVAAYDLDGNLLNARASIETPSDQPTSQGSPKISYKMQQRIEVPLAARFLRIAVRDPKTDRTGAMEIPLPLAPENQVAQAH